MARKRRWLRGRAFLLCERADGEPGPWTLHGVRNDFALSSPFAGITAGPASVPLTVFVRLLNVSRRRSSPREIAVHVYDHESTTALCQYRLPTRTYPPGIIVETAMRIEPPPISAPGWCRLALVLDDEDSTVLSRSEVYLTP